MDRTNGSKVTWVISSKCVLDIGSDLEESLKVSQSQKSGIGNTQMFSDYALKYGSVTQLAVGPRKNLVLISDPQEVDVRPNRSHL